MAALRPTACRFPSLQDTRCHPSTRSRTCVGSPGSGCRACFMSTPTPVRGPSPHRSPYGRRHIVLPPHPPAP
ncbi:hypothetical protein CNE_2c21470 [Cupriavidus necator N-1]|uniref:Uncharacterized protein n=1 Tax=Cupriavidus necator (strain ATCC 43291 / DSM 13513 / CCUG 52238 / LMG 8453 / N-1) TaxID=1042878 RepID=F8GSW9_CUPNN|nr:hypothetical protein CNE_2c21470 [Cupriavidus necator N-1]